MKDRAPANPGRVLITPENGAAAYYATVTRADNPTQEGDPLNRNTFLKDKTAALYGLDENAVPDDVLLKTSRFNASLGNEYVWSKTARDTVLVYGNSEIQNAYFYTNAMDTAPLTIQYSSEIQNENGTATLVSPSSATWQVNKSYPNELALVGKYFEAYRNGSMLFGGFCDNVSLVDDITLKYLKFTFRTVRYSEERTLVGYVNSDDPNAYPPAVDDGFAYQALGMLGGIGRIATGSYAGTGTYGSANPMELTFDFEVKLLSIFCGTPGPDVAVYTNSYASDKSNFSVHIPVFAFSRNPEAKNTRVFRLDASSYNYYITTDGKTLSWFSTNAASQLNIAGSTYYYIARG